MSLNLFSESVVENRLINGYLHQVYNFTSENAAYISFKCWGSNTTYNITRYDCTQQYYSAVCENDLKFYQACGVQGNECTFLPNPGHENFLCGYHICQTSKPDNFSGKSVEWYYDCNNKTNCVNKNNIAVDEKFCDYGKNPYKCAISGKRILKEKKCDSHVDCLLHIADDEVGCNHTYGVECTTILHEKEYDKWELPRYTCVKADYFSQCSKNEHLQNCDAQFGKCKANYFYSSDIAERNLTKKTMCSPYKEVCLDGRDQINCTNPVLSCHIDGKESTLTEIGICTGYPLCSDGLDNICQEVEANCNVHKHYLCDSHESCPFGGDEASCNDLTSIQTCVRKVRFDNKRQSLPILKSWLCDGVEDCENGIDEDKTKWKVCGKLFTRIRCVEQTDACREMYKCRPRSSTELIPMEHLCDGIASCYNEIEICAIASSRPPVQEKVINVKREKEKGYVRLLHCVSGISAFACKESKFLYQPLAFGAERTTILHPEVVDNAKCKHSYGEVYVYLTCLGLCGNDFPCPLTGSPNAKCLGQEVPFTLSKDMQHLVKIKYNRYSPTNYTYYDAFYCTNGKCVSFDKVCNLANDCGDWSDEESCENHFTCASNKTVIPLSSVCDGVTNCDDGSDECNEECHPTIIQHTSLKYLSWLIGSVALIMNSIVAVRQGSEVILAETKTGMQNSVFVTAIAIGDFLVGLYLILLGSFDIAYNERYCKNKYIWLTSDYCTVLGVISTFGSQLSLFSMTFLSCNRAINLRTMSLPSRRSRADIALTFSLALLVVSAALGTALVPLAPMFEDFFVNGMYYGQGNPLLIAAPSVEHHGQILHAYYGRTVNKASWKIYSHLISAMFTSDHGSIFVKKLGFYGNDGVCLFKYFVKDDDPQRLFTAMLMIVNGICFILIFCSYFFVVVMVKSLQQIVTTTNDSSLKLQKKISAIIVTDFICWVPFIFASLLHYIEVIDAENFYELFSIILLPVNSMINPLLYNSSISSFAKRYSAYFRKAINRNSIVSPTITMHILNASPSNASISNLDGKLNDNLKSVKLHAI